MFETPVYKLLARNDTGQAPGHQGGIVIPADLEDYFPDVEGEISAANPTADVIVIADLVVAGRYVDTVSTRYQYQTWGGTRSPERRLTGGLGPLRNVANPNDLVLFSRSSDDHQRMLITLVQEGTAEYESILSATSGARWGVVQGLPEPTRNRDIRDAEAIIEETSSGDFSLYDDDRQTVESPVSKKARDAAFRKKLMKAYNGARCMATGELSHEPGGLVNLDAAHIVSVKAGGSDDLRNGLLLSKDVHWAFDKGLFSVADDYTVLLSDFARRSENNEVVKRIDGQRLDFGNALLRPHMDAIGWHREYVFLD